ncbi:FAD/NAD(P)-binding protein [Rhizobium beringeri]
MASQPDGWLADHNIRRAQIGPSFIPTRWVLGEYLNAQFTALAARAASHGIAVQYLNTVKVKDIEAIGDRRFGVIFEGLGASMLSVSISTRS